MTDPFKFQRGQVVEWQPEPGRRFRRAEVVSRVPTYIGTTPAFMYRVYADGQEHWADEGQLRTGS